MTIIFFRENFYKGTKFAIKSAQIYSPNNRIILIGDNKQDKTQAEFAPISDYSTYSNKFKNIYKHNSIHSREWCLSSISMYLVLLEFCQKNNITNIFFPDTDILTFCDINEASGPFSKFDYTKSVFSQDSTQAPLIFNNIEVLSEFKDFLFKFYENFDKNEQIICVMELWRRFRHTHPQFLCGNTSEIINDSTFDHNLCADYHNYEYDGTSKVVRFKNGFPYILKKDLNKDIKFNILHCWGIWKDRIEELFNKALESKEKP